MRLARPVAIREASPELLREIEQTGSEARRRFHGLAPSEIPELGPARRLYRAFGVDPGTAPRP